MSNMTQLHSLIAHLPAILVIAGFMVEVFLFSGSKKESLKKINFYLLIIAAAISFAAILTGRFFTDSSFDTTTSAYLMHEIFAGITAWTLLFNAILCFLIQHKYKEKSTLKMISFILYIISVLAVIATGYYGSLLVK